MLQPLYTMNGFNWFDKRGVEGVGFVRTLRTLLTNNLPKILPDLGTLTRTRWSKLLLEQKTVDGTKHAAIYPMMMNMVVLLNARSLFGEDLSMSSSMSYRRTYSDEVGAVKDEKFMKSALGYVEETLLNAELVKLLPKCMAPSVGGILSRCLSSHKTFFKSLIPATEQRIEEQRLRRLGHSVPQRVGLPQYDD